MNFRNYIPISKCSSLLYGWLFLLIPLFTGCINENLPVCDDENDETCIRFNFIYDYNLDEMDLFAEQVDHITLFIYKENGQLEQTLEVYREDMEENHTVSLMLSPGEYTAVAWGNCHTDSYHIYNEETLSDMQLEMTCIDENQSITRTNPGSLFHASTPFPVIQGDEYTVPMEFIKNSNEIKVIIKGLTEEDRQKAEERFLLRMSSKNWRYNFDNTISSEQHITYRPEPNPDDNISEDPDDISVSFTFYPLRLFTYDMETVLTLKYKSSQTGRETALEKPLVPYLLNQESGTSKSLTSKKNENEYLDRRDTYEIIFVLGANVDGSIELKEWEEVNQGGKLE